MTDKVPNPQFDKEQAEGERETVEESLSHERQQRQGVGNRSLEEEQGEQAELPPRGEAKRPEPGGHA